LEIDRGYIRPEDEAPSTPEGDVTAEPDADPSEPAVQRVVIMLGGQPAEPEEEDDDAVKPLPERLVIELTAHRTIALRNALADHPHVAMTALLHKLVSDTFQTRMYKGALQASVNHVFFPVQDEETKDSPPARAVRERHDGWAGDIPADDDALWDWLAALEDANRMALLAHCVSYGVNALYEKPNPFASSGVSQHGLDMRLAHADRIARATGLDMVEAGWRPTFGNYLNRVTKPRILQAVREGAGDHAAQLIDHLKKGDMAKEAERLLADSGWLPEPLRMHRDADAVIDTDPSGEDERAPLPAFLTEGDDDGSDAEDEEHHLDAAE
ncbi:MAG: DNA-binding protein, partial [Rhizobiaceae bacterium]|nr:DNA-binding protein [Rhizobiaceae bacterium]